MHCAIELLDLTLDDHPSPLAQVWPSWLGHHLVFCAGASMSEHFAINASCSHWALRENCPCHPDLGELFGFPLHLSSLFWLLNCSNLALAAQVFILPLCTLLSAPPCHTYTLTHRSFQSLPPILVYEGKVRTTVNKEVVCQPVLQGLSCNLRQLLNDCFRQRKLKQLQDALCFRQAGLLDNWMYISGRMLMNPDSYIFPYIEKH